MSYDIKKLKDHVTALKEYADGLKLERPDQGMVLALSAELSLRGVIVNISFLDDDDLTAGVLVILDQIIANAGKLLLDESSSCPKPLIAGAATVAGTIAEKVAQSLLFLLNRSKSCFAVKNIFETSGIARALRRCEDVADIRLATMLSTILNTDQIPLAETTALFMRISVGNMTRAALLSPQDVPIFWKRALDTVLITHQLMSRVQDDQQLRSCEWDQLGIETFDSYQDPDATTPLLKLISIANSKGNKRRVAELRLHLLESILSGLNSIGQRKMLKSDMGKSAWNRVTLAFFDADNLKRNQLDDILTARNTLRHFNDDIVEADFVDCTMLLSFKYLRLSTELAHEDYIISSIAENRRIAYKNRTGGIGGGLSDGGTNDDTNSFIRSVRKDLLADRLSPDEYEAKIFSDFKRTQLEVFAVDLRDALISSTGFRHVEDELHKAASKLLCIYMSRLNLRAQSLGINGIKKDSIKVDVQSPWTQVISFSSPMISFFAHGDMEIKSLDSCQIIIDSSQSFLSAYWIGYNGSFGDSNIMIQHCSLMLSKCMEYQRQMAQKQKLSNESDETVKFISSKESSADDIELNYSLTACKSFLCLETITSKDTVIDEDFRLIKEMTETTLDFIKRITANPLEAKVEVKYGYSFINLLLCWSGLFSSPWPFCTIADARAIIRYVKSSISHLKIEWGRDLSVFESILLQLAEADSECGTIAGGFAPEALISYTQSINLIERLEISDWVDDYKCMALLLKAHALLGLSRLKLGSSVGQSESVMEAEELARTSISLLQQIKPQGSRLASKLFMYGDSFDIAIQFHICSARQLLSEALIRQHRFSDAHEFLSNAVHDAPTNFHAAFDLASFMLRMSTYDNVTAFGSKQASQLQLLKAQKLGSEKADPYALIGIFYEAQKDLSRAFGFYSKALIVNPCHPVAGRGILRLKDFSDVKQLCELASSVSSPDNGWAWVAIGQAKSLLDGDDTMGTLCFQQALRCKDIDIPEIHKLGIFFNLPNDANARSTGVGGEKSRVWALLASCYRRLGKYSAAHRAYRSALETAEAPGDILCQMAQVLLEVGMVEEAERNFQLAFKCAFDDSTKFIAGYGVGRTHLDRAKTFQQEGKFGFSFSHVMAGIEILHQLPSINDTQSTYFYCSEKLLGDLYTYISFLPASVLQDPMTKREFLCQGEIAYRRALDALSSRDLVDGGLLIADAYCDIATNILLQVRDILELIPLAHETIDQLGLKNMLNGSIELFAKAIDVIDIDSARAWNGIGCALTVIDPVLAQHAFCRAIEIDSTLSDSLANFGFLMSQNFCFNESNHVFDALSQIDNPQLWIGKGISLVEKAFSEKNISLRDELFQQGADAFRASLLQGSNSPAILGLSLSKIRTSSKNVASPIDHDVLIKGRTYLCTYLDLTGKQIGTPALAASLMTCEKALHLIYESGCYSVGQEVMRMGLEQLIESDELLDNFYGVHENSPLKALSCNDFYDVVANKEILKSIVLGCRQLLSPLSKATAQRLDIPSHRHALFSCVNSQEDILLNPWNGQRWLSLAKNLSAQITSSENPYMNLIKTAFSAAEKAKMLFKRSLIMTNSLSEPNTTAAMLSEALALTAWLEMLYFKGGVDSKFDYQRALILDPENKIARLWFSQ